MASYYYLISSLPDLRTAGEMPIRYEEFLQCCESNVSESVYELLANLSIASKTGPLIAEWAGFYENLSKELNYQRSVGLGRTYSSAYDKNGVNAQVVSAALSAGNPLEAERILLDYEFEQLDYLTELHFFDEYVLFGYALKLKLLERQSCFEKTRGQTEFKMLFESVQQSVYSLS